jgi:hypothetical protein
LQRFSKGKTLLRFTIWFFHITQCVYIYPYQGTGLPYFQPSSIDGLCGARGMIEITSILVSHLLQSQKPDPKRKSNHTIISRYACRGMMDMVRWILGLEWVLVITIWFDATPFCMISLLYFLFSMLDMGYHFSFFIIMLWACLSLFFWNSPCLLFKDIFGRLRSHHIQSFTFMEWMDDTMLTSSVEA